jgi:hypothetical protein
VRILLLSKSFHQVEPTIVNLLFFDKEETNFRINKIDCSGLKISSFQIFNPIWLLETLTIFWYECWQIWLNGCLINFFESENEEFEDWFRWI